MAPGARSVAERLPEGVEIQLVRDSSRFIEDSISEVRSAGLWGGVLAVLVLFLFLHQLRATAIIALSIPISVAVTFAPLHLLGVSLNLMSLGGLALVVGMLVDNSVVVRESIGRCREEGDHLAQAAVRGTREVAGAVTASTLTTVAVFLPLAFVEGIAGQLFGNLALTVVCGLVASLIVALFLIPTLSALEIRLPAAATEAPADGARAANRPQFRLWWADLRDGLRSTGLWLRADKRRLVLAPLVAAYALLRCSGLLLGFLVLWCCAWVVTLSGRLGAVLWRLVARATGGPVGGLLKAFERRFEAFRSGYRTLLVACLRRGIGKLK